jgi:zinc transporter ZupT
LKAHPTFVPYVLCIVAGIMLSSSFLELLPESALYNRPGVVLAGFATGTSMMLATIWYAET